MPHAGGTLGKYVVHNFICLCFMVEGSYGFGKGKRGRKGDPIIWEGPLGPDSFPEPVFEFPLQHKSEFTNENPLRQYDNRREPWPKYRHGEDCLVQMCTDGMDGGRVSLNVHTQG